MADEEIQRAIRVLERHGCQKQIIEKFLLVQDSNFLLEQERLIEHALHKREISVNYTVELAGAGRSQMQDTLKVFRDLYVSLNDFYTKEIQPKYPTMLTESNIRFIAGFSSYDADPNREISMDLPFEDKLDNRHFHIVINVKALK